MALPTAAAAGCRPAVRAIHDVREQYNGKLRAWT